MTPLVGWFLSIVSMTLNGEPFPFTAQEAGPYTSEAACDAAAPAFAFSLISKTGKAKKGDQIHVEWSCEKRR